MKNDEEIANEERRERNDFYLNGIESSNGDSIPIQGLDILEKMDQEGKKNTEKERTMPVLALRNMVLFPGVVMPISVGREKSMNLIKNGLPKDGMIAVIAQKDKRVDEPEFDDLYKIGTLAKVVKTLDMPDNTMTVIVEGRRRLELKELNQYTPYFKGVVEDKPETKPVKTNKKLIALGDSIKDVALNMIKNAPTAPKELQFAIRNMDDNYALINYVSTNFWLNVQEKQTLLEMDDIMERGRKLYEQLAKEEQMLQIKLDIQKDARVEMDAQQKDYFLRQQLRAIQEQLGDTVDSEIDDYVKRAKKKKWTKQVKAVFEREINKIEKLNPSSPDYGVESTYIDTLLNVPFGVYSKDSLDIKKTRKQLDADHYGLDKVKERIIENLSVLKLKGDMKAPILCLYGAPGVGKTSLGKSIATSLNRKYVRISLGGVHDEAEIRGHRRTYIGALPGRIVKSLIKAGTSNPVFVLDEIDKMAEASINGDPSSALLEVLDPEQNNAFHDNYLDVDVDLSKVLFIATANTLETIPRPLLDRMELIEVNGYVEEEKIAIAKKYLVGKQEKENGIDEGIVTVNDEGLGEIIGNYTRESGVRELDRKIGKLMRKVACRIASGENVEHIEIGKEDVVKYLGPKEFTREEYEGNEYTGVVTGLAWTQVGGEILYVESSLDKVKTEGKLSMTGNLGNVMKESIMLAYEYVKSHAEEIGIDRKVIEENNIYVHVPEGAVPKDGPSAGITIVTSIVSSLLGKRIKKGIAMTGEITLRGKVMPVGGIREKILAAKRAGIKEIILCAENKKDIDEIKKAYLKGLRFKYVKDIKEVLAETGLAK